MSEVPTLQSSRIGPTKRLKDKSDVPKARLGILPKYIYKLKANDKATYFSPAKWVLPSASARESEEREFVVDSGASMHVVSETDLNSAELETMRTSRNPTTVMTANGEVRTNKEATVYVEQVELFVNVMLLPETPAVLSLGETLRGTWVHQLSGKAVKIHISSKMARELDCNTIKLCTTCGSWNISEFFLNYAFICLVTIFITGVNIG